MKKIIVGLLVPFALAAAGCERTVSVTEEQASLEKPTRSTTQSKSTDTVTTGPTADSSTAASQERTTTAQGPSTTETPASQGKY